MTYQLLPSIHRRLCGLLLSTRRGQLALISGYIHYADGSGLPELSSLLTLARQHTALIILGLDCNGHSTWWGPPDTITNSIGALVEDFILQERLAVENQWPCPPTFHSEQGFQSWIDLTLATPSLSPSVTEWHVLSDVPLDSDHSALTYTVNLEPIRAVETRLDWRHVPWDSFRQSLQSELHSHFPSLPKISSTSDLDLNVTTLTTAFQTTIQAHVPVKHVSTASHPWWSPHLSSLRHDHLHARRRWKRTRTPEDRRALNISKRALRNAIIDAKRHSWRQFCENTSPTDIWKSFKKVSRLSPSRTIQPLIHEGVQHFSAADQAEVFADRFFTPIMTPLTPFHHRIQSDVETLLSEFHTIPSHPITQPEIRQAISKSGPWKAPGRDGVPYICFKQCISLVLPILQHLFTASLRLGHVPAFWKVATVVTVPKPGRDPLSPKGYRPISLLPTLSKLLERIITDRLTYFLETHHLLAPTQYGFRQGRGTEEALWCLISAASIAMQTRHRLALVSLDIQGAYDTVWHAGLVWKLSSLKVPP